jgi:hypothetical protein
LRCGRSPLLASTRHFLLHADAIAGGLVLAAAIVSLQVMANLVDYGVYDYRLALVNPNDESNLFAWISGGVVAFSACLCLFRSVHSRSDRRDYMAVGLLLAIIAVENRARLYEETVHRPMVYVPLLGGLFASLLLISWPWPAGSRRAIWAGLSALVLSFALHKLAPHLLGHYGYGPGSWPYEVKVSLKESGELSGWILIGAALLTAPNRADPPVAARGPSLAAR